MNGQMKRTGKFSCRRIILALGFAAALGAAPVGTAWADDWHGDRGWHEGEERHEWREHERREHEWREHERWEHRHYYAPPPVVYAAPPPQAVYVPPPVVMAPAPVPGVSIVLPIRIR